MKRAKEKPKSKIVPQRKASVARVGKKRHEPEPKATTVAWVGEDSDEQMQRGVSVAWVGREGKEPEPKCMSVGRVGEDGDAPVQGASSVAWVGKKGEEPEPTSLSVEWVGKKGRAPEAKILMNRDACHEKKREEGDDKKTEPKLQLRVGGSPTNHWQQDQSRR